MGHLKILLLVGLATGTFTYTGGALLHAQCRRAVRGLGLLLLRAPDEALRILFVTSKAVLSPQLFSSLLHLGVRFSRRRVLHNLAARGNYIVAPLVRDDHADLEAFVAGQLPELPRDWRRIAREWPRGFERGFKQNPHAQGLYEPMVLNMFSWLGEELRGGAALEHLETVEQVCAPLLARLRKIPPVLKWSRGDQTPPVVLDSDLKDQLIHIFEIGGGGARPLYELVELVWGSLDPPVIRLVQTLSIADNADDGAVAAGDALPGTVAMPASDGPGPAARLMVRAPEWGPEGTVHGAARSFLASLDSRTLRAARLRWGGPGDERTLEEVAECLGISRGTVHNLVGDKRKNVGGKRGEVSDKPGKFQELLQRFTRARVASHHVVFERFPSQKK